MICFEVWINGEKKCIAGEEDITLSAFIAYIRSEKSENQGTSRISINISGTRNLGNNITQGVDWLKSELSIGDEIIIKITDSDHADNPTEIFPKDKQECSFCKKTSSSVKKIIVGARAKICDECVELCIESIADTQHDKEKVEDKAKDERIKCSFCGKSNSEVSIILTESDNCNICNECVKLCEKIINETVDT